MNPYRLVALAVIAMFALGYARLLIDAGVRDEHPPTEVPLDLVTRAACTAVAEPLGEALDVSWEPVSKVRDGLSICALTANRAPGLTVEQTVANANAVFRLLRWSRIASHVEGETVYERHPVRCVLRVNELIDTTCWRDPPGDSP